MKKAISYMACSMAAMLALSACGSAASSASTVASSSDAASTESTAASEASNEPVTITFAQYSGSGDNEQYLQQMVDNYMKENPNVTIDLQTYGYDDYFTQMTAKVSGGQAPDVFELDYQNFVSYAKKGALMPLDDILTKDGIDTSIYNDMALKAFSADGVQYGVPDSFSNVVLIYNKDLFDQAGIDYPTDDWKWEDAMAAAEKIRALGDNIFGYYHPISFNEFYKTVKQNGGSLFNDDFTEFTMDTPENIETLQYMVDMQQKTNVMPTEEQMAGMGDWDLFESGRLGMIPTGIWAFNTFADACDFNWDICVEPGGTQKATHFFSNALVVNADSDKKEAAATWINWLASSDTAAQMRIDAGWDLPAINNEDVLSGYLKLTPPENRQAVFDSLNYLTVAPIIEDYSLMSDIITNKLSLAASGEITVKEALDQAQEECTAQIKLQ